MKSFSIVLFLDLTLYARKNNEKCFKLDKGRAKPEGVKQVGRKVTFALESHFSTIKGLRKDDIFYL